MTPPSAGRTIDGFSILPASEAFHAPRTIFEPTRTSLCNPVVFTNAMERDPDFARWMLWRYAAREEDQPAVVAGWYQDATVIGDGPFLVFTDRGIASEHIPRGMPDSVVAELARHVAAARASAVDVWEPCALVCNPGLWVWGHWLLEILPRAILASRLYAGGVRLALPRGLIDPAERGFLSEQVLASLAAYGIARDQLFPIEAGRMYRFQRLLDFSGVEWLRHPQVLAAVRDIPGLPPYRGRRGITAVLRGGGAKRSLSNRGEIAALLDRRGAGLLDPGVAPFLAQVMAFRDSEVVVGDLGSNICAALYAPPGAGLVTLAPDNWCDGAVPRLLQDLDPYVAEIRGGTEARNNDEAMFLPYSVEPDTVEAGLDAVIEAVRAPLPRNTACVGGRLVARRFGTSLFSIAFGRDGDAVRCAMEGFAPPEPSGQWSVGTESRLTLTGFMAPALDCWLRLEGVGRAAPPRVPETEFAVEVNGEVLGRFTVAGSAGLEMLVPAALLQREAPVVLRFCHPDCASPAALGISGDARPLGFFFKRLTVHRAEG